MSTPLRLVVLEGPGDPAPGSAFELEGEASFGRSADCTHCLADPWVSREHARVFPRGGSWFIADCDSTGGTFVNGARLPTGGSVELSDGDEIGIGPWSLRIGEPADAPSITLGAGGERPSIQTPTRRLRALSSCIDRLIAAGDEQALARAALESVIEGAAFRRGAVLRPPAPGGQAPLVIALERAGDDWRELDERAIGVPSSLVATAAGGHAAVIQGQDFGNVSESIVSRAIHSAVCCPVKLDGRVTLLIYLDSRAGEAPVGDAAAFCQDVAQVYAMALAYRGRVEMERKQAAMRAELDRAAFLREMLEPKELVEIGPIRVCHRMSAGAVVTGDLVDLHAMDDGSIVVVVGDAMGHGVGAALLTSLVQAHLHAEITRGESLASAAVRTNRFIARRPTDGSFVTLWIGRIFPDGRFEHLDAGHGHWLVARAGGGLELVERASGLPLGIESDAEYVATTGRLGPGDRIVLFTDGVTEQRLAGGPLGAKGVGELVGRSRDCEGDVRMVVEALAGASMVDDATIVSIELRG